MWTCWHRLKDIFWGIVCTHILIGIGEGTCFWFCVCECVCVCACGGQKLASDVTRCSLPLIQLEQLANELHSAIFLALPILSTGITAYTALLPAYVGSVDLNQVVTVAEQTLSRLSYFPSPWHVTLLLLFLLSEAKTSLSFPSSRICANLLPIFTAIL